MNVRKSRGLGRPALLLTCVLTAGALSTSSNFAERPRIYAITHATVITSPGQSIEDATVVLRDGLIESVGAEVRVPADAVEIDATGRFVYPGLIDVDSSLGRKSATGRGGGGGGGGAPGGEGGSPPLRSGAVHPLARIHPESLVRDDLLPFTSDDAKKDMARMRDMGFTAVLVTPASGILRGRSAAILLAEDSTVAEMILADDVAQHASFARERGRGGGYPGSLMGVVAAMRQAFLDASRYATWSHRYASDPAGMNRPPRHAAFEALMPLLDQRQVLIAGASDPDDALLADRLAREFDLRLVIGGSGHEWEIADQIAATGRTMILPVGFPDKPDVDDEDEALAVSRRVLRRYADAAAGPGVLHTAGVRFALSLNSLKNAANFPKNMNKIVAAGLPADAALAALTTVPAELMGQSRSLGTIERGKIANLFVTDGPVFEKDTKVRRVFVDGVSHEIQVKEKPKGDPNAVVDPRGEWSVVFDMGARTLQRTWSITGEKGAADTYRGTAETGRGTVDFESIELAGNVLTVVLPGRRGSQEITVIVEGETFEGTAEMGPGTVTVNGSRTGGPDGGGA